MRKTAKYHRLNQVEDSPNHAYRPSMGNISEAFENTRPPSTRPSLRYSKLHSSSISSPSVGYSPDTPTPFSDHSTLLNLGSSTSEVTTPQPIASSDVGLPGTTLSAVPEKLETPPPTASLGEMISEATGSTPCAANDSGASTPRPGSTVPVQASSPRPSSVGVAVSSDEPPRTPSPLTPTQIPLPVSPPDSVERQS